MPFITIILFGALSATFAVIVELSLFSLSVISDSAPITLFSSIFDGTFTLSLLLVLIGTAFIEEASKYVFLLRYKTLILKDTLIPLRSALLYGLLFGNGFALPEAWLIASSASEPVWFPIIGIVLVHILTSLTVTAFLLSSARRFSSIKILCLTTFFHTLYNLSVLFFFTHY